jgi:hypothetical protein
MRPVPKFFKKIFVPRSIEAFLAFWLLLFLSFQIFSIIDIDVNKFSILLFNWRVLIWTKNIYILTQHVLPINYIVFICKYSYCMGSNASKSTSAYSVSNYSAIIILRNGTAFIKFLGDLDVPEHQLLLDFKRIILMDEILEVIVKRIFRNKQCFCYYWYGLMLKYHVFTTICLCLLLTTIL